jgi:predicted RNA-binding protein YlqC (UPF0109 family)
MLNLQNGTYLANEVISDSVRDAEIGELLVAVVRRLVDEPEDVNVEFLRSDHTDLLEFYVAPDDVSKVVGKGGATIAALRKLAYAMLGASGVKGRKYMISARSTDEL